MKTKSLFEQAKEIKLAHVGPNAKVTPEMIELAIAWAKDEISTTQVAKVLRVTTPGATVKLAGLLREATRLGLITFNV